MRNDKLTTMYIDDNIRLNYKDSSQIKPLSSTPAAGQLYSFTFCRETK